MTYSKSVAVVVCITVLGCASNETVPRYPGNAQALCAGVEGLQCGNGAFCDHSANGSCGETPAYGVCIAPPVQCTREYRPVCGCDGRNFANVCVAHSHGVSVRHHGLCGQAPAATAPIAPSADVACGTIDAPACPAGMFCKRSGETACAESSAGQCVPRPTACTREYRPVCGCDGRSYANRCVADSHGVSIQGEGLCAAAQTKQAEAPPSSAPKCVRGGCSGELCVVAGSQMASTCEYKPEYGCYRDANCEVQEDGGCAWSETEALRACLSNPPLMF